VNLQAYAAHRKRQGLRGQTHVAVIKAIDSGRLTEPAVRKAGNRWHIDPALADAQWADNTNATSAPDLPEPIDPESQEPLEPPSPPAKQAKAKQAKARPAEAASPQPATRSKQPPAASGGPSIGEARRALAVYKAERERLAMMREKGELILVSEVRQEAARLARQVRDLLLMIPNRNAAKLATLQDQEEIRVLLQTEIESALRGLANA
jgi:hypothetical protein